MAKLADALASGASGSNPLEVQVLFRPRKKLNAAVVKLVYTPVLGTGGFISVRVRVSPAAQSFKLSVPPRRDSRKGLEVRVLFWAQHYAKNNYNKR